MNEIERFIHDHKHPIMKVDIPGTKLFFRPTTEEFDFIENSLRTFSKVLSHSRVEKRCARIQADWLDSEDKARVKKIVKGLLQNFGYQDKHGIFLFPEEALFLLETMPRSKEGKKRCQPLKENLQRAKDAIESQKISHRIAAKIFNVSRMTLQRYINQENIQPGSYRSYSNCAVKKVLTNTEEANLCRYLILASKMHYGLHRNQLRALAYEFAISNKKAVPESCHEKRRSGKNWFRCFMRRHSDLSLRKPEATSLSRSTSFNKHNVTVFFTKLKKVMEHNQFDASSIYKMDETSNSSVHIPGKVIAVKGEKQVGSATSGERGVNVTMIACVNAMGNSIPPMFIFLRVNFKEAIMMHGAPAGAIGTAVQSGWINTDVSRLDETLH